MGCPMGAYDDETHPAPAQPVQLTPAAAGDPVFVGLPPRFPTLQWHSDTFELPEGATLLASSPAYLNQAFVIRRAYGLQFHLEVGRELASEWAQVPAYAESLETIMGLGSMPRLLEQVTENADELLPLARRLFASWLEHVVRVPARAIG